MGKALRPEHIRFFTKRMDEHDLVSNCVLVANDHEFLFKIRRTLAGSESADRRLPILAEFYVRPKGAESDCPHADPTTRLLRRSTA